jgi:hypothetical protein
LENHRRLVRQLSGKIVKAQIRGAGTLGLLLAQTTG